MSELSIVFVFLVIAVAFVWVSVKRTTTSKVNNEATRKFSETVHAKLLELYGVEQTVGGITVKVLPPELQASVDAFVNR